MRKKPVRHSKVSKLGKVFQAGQGSPIWSQDRRHAMDVPIKLKKRVFVGPNRIPLNKGDVGEIQGVLKHGVEATFKVPMQDGPAYNKITTTLYFNEFTRAHKK